MIAMHLTKGKRLSKVATHVLPTETLFKYFAEV